MKIEKLKLPEKIFGMEVGLLVVLSPLLGVAILVVISINLLLLPKIDDYRTIMVQLQSLDSQKLQLVQKRDYLLSIDQDKLKQNTDFIVNAMLPQNNSYLLVDMVRVIADKYGYQIDSFSIHPGEVSKDYKQTTVNGVAGIPVVLSTIGPANRYLDLIKGLESSLPILSLNNFDMRSDGNTATMDLTISAYYIKDNSSFDISKLTLADLTLTKDESDLIAKLSQFTVLEKAGDLQSGFNTNKGYVKYNRADPFNP